MYTRFINYLYLLNPASDRSSKIPVFLLKLPYFPSEGYENCTKTEKNRENRFLVAVEQKVQVKVDLRAMVHLINESKML